MHISICCIHVLAENTDSSFPQIRFRNWRKHLSTLYITFTRPTLEYSLIVWDGCSDHDNEKLEKEQLSTDIIVTGLLILYLENPFIQVDKIYNVYVTLLKWFNEWWCPIRQLILFHINIKMYPVISQEINTIISFLIQIRIMYLTW